MPWIIIAEKKAKAFRMKVIPNKRISESFFQSEQQAGKGVVSAVSVKSVAATIATLVQATANTHLARTQGNTENSKAVLAQCFTPPNRERSCSSPFDRWELFSSSRVFTFSC